MIAEWSRTPRVEINLGQYRRLIVAKLCPGKYQRGAW